MKYFLALLAISLLLTWAMFAIFPNLAGGRTVTLAAKPWNEGQVHLWHSIVEGESAFVDVPSGTRCERLDRQIHKLVGPPPLITYYRVDCNGVTGYVEVDQTY